MGKKILIVGSHAPPFGGVANANRDVAIFLSKNGWDVKIVADMGTRWQDQEVQEINGYEVYRPGGLSLLLAFLKRPNVFQLLKDLFFKVGRKDQFLLGPYRAVTNYLMGFAQRFKPDVIYVNKIHRAYSVQEVSRRLNIPFVTSVYGEMYDFPNKYRSIRKEIESIVESSSAVMSCSDHCGKSFSEIGFSPKVKTVYFGVDVQKFHQVDTDLQDLVREENGLAQSDRVVLYLARMVEEMGLGVFLKSIPRVLERDPSVKFVIAGRPGELTAAAESVAGAYPNNVKVLANVPYEKIAALYAVSSTVVVPSINKRACLGLAIIEGMSSQKPVIVSNVGGGPEVIRDGMEGYLFEPENDQDLAEKILRVLGDQALSQTMGQRGRARAIELFDREESGKRIEKVFNAAIQSL